MVRPAGAQAPLWCKHNESGIAKRPAYFLSLLVTAEAAVEASYVIETAVPSISYKWQNSGFPSMQTPEQLTREVFLSGCPAGKSCCILGNSIIVMEAESKYLLIAAGLPGQHSKRK